MDGNALSRLRAFQDLEKDNERLRWKLASLKAALKSSVSTIEEVEAQKMSSQWALFACEAGQYRCIGVYDETADEQDDDVMADVVLILPLPDHETLREFDGF